MAGIYIHIPFCATRCIYCDFYSTTERDKESQFLVMLQQEMADRRSFLTDTIQTIYLGGGTPSQLHPASIRQLLCRLEELFDLSHCQEITIEANPEDIAQPGYQVELITRREMPGQPMLHHPVNRVSMGVQTMVDEELRLLRRRHNAERVRMAVERLRQAGIINLSLDLMYGLPTQTLLSWEYSIEQLLQLKPQHISAYNLSVEEDTPLYHMVERGQLQPCDDELCVQMAALLRQRLSREGFEQYEISNYALPGFYSRHNSSYWMQSPYLGLGPGAHSYDGRCCRSYNSPNLAEYLRGHRQEETETLTDLDLYNERIMLGLRTAKGIDLCEPVIAPHLSTLSPIIEQLLQQGWICRTDTKIKLTDHGLAMGDAVIRELIILDS